MRSRVPILCLMLAHTGLQAADVLPFPENRLRSFYAKQAQAYLDSDQPIPEILPPFPGLDGGKFGHWGQNTEANYYDHGLNEVDFGSVVSQVTNHFGKRTTKAVNLKLGNHAAMFDPEKLNFTAAWKGGFVRWESRRFGLNTGVTPVGSEIDLSDSGWTLPDNVPSQYHGFYRSGEAVVFHYTIGGAKLWDWMTEEAGALIRTITLEGTLPAGVRLKESAVPVVYSNDAKHTALTQRAQWADKVTTTHGELGHGGGAYVVDTLTIPYGAENPFNSPFRVGGFDFLPDGRAAVCTIIGEVWLVDGVDADLATLTWTRIAAGLNQALGLVVKDGKIHVLGRDQITRLHDLNGDDEIDFYECLTHDYPTDSGNAYACTLHQDTNGTLYWFTRSQKWGVTRFKENGTPESIATGLRGTNGTGVSPDGRIVLSTVQEGSWTPATAIFEVSDGSYHGFGGPSDAHGPYGYDLPLCFIPRGIDNSAGDIVFLPKDARLGPLAGYMVGTSLGACQHYLVLREETENRSQGGIVHLEGDFLSGAHRSRYNPHDGQLYIAGSDGWESYASEDGSLQRVRYTGHDLHLPTAVETRENGLLVRFNCEVDPATVSVDRTFVEQWNYLYSEAYGSAEYSVKQPERLGHDAVTVESVHLLADGRSVFVEIPQLHPVMQLHLYMDLRTSEGDTFRPDLYYSIFELGEPFTEFESYAPVAKADYPTFPTAESHSRDPRLDAQEKLGKSTGAFETVIVDAIPGLLFSPNRIQVKAGKRTAIVLRNTDVEMPHNLVIAEPDHFEALVEESMKLAADPKAIGIHYVPESEGLIAMSPLIYPGEQYAIYFDAPDTPGEYPFVCTFPGHWIIMRGVMEVVE